MIKSAGMADPDDWISGKVLKSMTHTDDVISNMLRFCHLAGPSQCSFATGNSTTDVYQRFEKMIWHLDAQKATANNWKNASDISAAWNFVQSFMMGQAYDPNNGFPVLADTFVAWEKVIATNFSAENIQTAAAEAAGPSVTYAGFVSTLPLIRITWPSETPLTIHSR